jgi:hypothetical protein
MLGLAVNGLRYAHESAITRCANPTIADVSLSVMAKAASFLKNYSQGSNRGLFYAVQYESFPPDPIPVGSGTAEASIGSSLINLPGGHALTFFNCNGTDYIGLDTIRKVFKVVNCPSDTLVTVDVAPETAVSGSSYRKGYPMATNCAPSLATYCADLSAGVPPNPSVGDRNIIGDVKAGFGYLYTVTGDLKYINWGDDFMAADYGGPASGPGGLTTPCPGAGCAGPGADGGVGAFVSALPPCNTSAPPCGGFGPQSGQGKYYGMGDGAGDTPNYLAFRTGSHTSMLRSKRRCTRHKCASR